MNYATTNELRHNLMCNAAPHVSLFHAFHNSHLADVIVVVVVLVVVGRRTPVVVEEVNPGPIHRVRGRVGRGAGRSPAGGGGQLRGGAGP
jgi:hypothetical protein